MKNTTMEQELKRMKFEIAQKEWINGKINQQEAAYLLGVSDRTFRRYLRAFEEEGLDGLIDSRINQISHLRAPVDEVFALTDKYKRLHTGWNVKHFYSWYKNKYEGLRSYTWVKDRLQEAGLVKKLPGKGKHRKHRERAAMAGMMLHQDGSSHRWIPDKEWDLIVTMDDATSEHYSMFFVREEGTASSFQGLRETIEKKGLCCSLYTDRGSHYWTTPEAGGKVDKENLTQFGRAMHQLGIEMIPAYSPEARGRSERAFKTHQGRLPQELAFHGITDMASANKYLQETYMPAFNREFMEAPQIEDEAFVPYIGLGLEEILCEQHVRIVDKNNCISYKGKRLQIPPDNFRYHYVKVEVRVHEYPNLEMAIFHGPRCLARYDRRGQLKNTKVKVKKLEEAIA